MDVLTSKEFIRASSLPADEVDLVTAPRLSPRVICDLRIAAEALLLGLLQLVVHVIYFELAFDASAQVLQYSIYASLSALLFFVYKRFAFGMRPQHLGSFSESFAKSLHALLATILTFVVIVFLSKAQEDVSRGWLVLWSVVGLGSLALSDWAIARQLGRADSPYRNLFVRRVAILGSNALTQQAAKLLAEFGPAESRLAAVVELAPAAEEEALARTLARLEETIEKERLNEIVLALPWSEHAQIIEIVERLAHKPIDISLCPDQLSHELATLVLQGSETPPFLPLVRHAIAHWGEIGKRAIDLLGTGAALVFFAPLLAAIAAAIRLDTPGPIFFRQERQGFNHDVFKVWKFRTMYHEVDGAIATFRQASMNDDRITPVGRLLRKTSLDELPQLINVLRGEMSLVGPRPHPLPLNHMFSERIRLYAARHRVRPGITGLAQINGYRGETDTHEKMAGRIYYDLEYVRTWSIWLDLKIMVLTLVRGFIHPNAY